MRKLRNSDGHGQQKQREQTDGRTDWPRDPRWWKVTEGDHVIQARTGLVVLSKQNFSRTIRAHFQFSTISGQRVGDLSDRESFIWNKNSSHSTLCFLLFIDCLSLYNYCEAGDEVKELTNIQFPLRNFFKRRLSIKLITKVVVHIFFWSVDPTLC